MAARPARDSLTPFINVNFCEPVMRNCPVRSRSGVHDRLQMPEQRRSVLHFIQDNRGRMPLQEDARLFSACSASLGRSRETKSWSGNRRVGSRFLPVWRAP